MADTYTPTSMSRWSLLNHKLPAANTITSLHVYDFDNTLFKTPLPNARIWNGATLGQLASQDVFSSGGWWHDARILAATGAGVAAEEPRAWDGWWNEPIVDLVRLSEQQPGALCVLLTGRSERGFGDLILRMVRAKGLHFDVVALKPAVGPNNEQFASTMEFKQRFLTALMETYARAVEIRIYEDRPRHVEAFRAFLERYSAKRREQHRTEIAGEVVYVTAAATTLDPVVEVAEVEHMINCHNAAVAAKSSNNSTGGSSRGDRRLSLHKMVFFTGYLLKDADSQRLLGLLRAHLARNPLPAGRGERDLKLHGNSIMISTQTCPPHILQKIGGLGRKVTWRVEALGSAENSVWAAKVRPMLRRPAGPAAVHTADPTPVVVLAVCRGTRPHLANRIHAWRPVAQDDAFEFETTVAEKAVLRVESERLPARHREQQQQQQPARSQPAAADWGDDDDGGGSGAGDNVSSSAGRSFSTANVPPSGPSALKRKYQGAPAHGSSSRGGRGGYYHGGRGGVGYGAAPYRGGGGYRGRGGPRGGYGRGGGESGSAKPHHFYHSLDDKGGTRGRGGSQPMVYDDAGN